ncbi:MAG: TIGR04282 family arsenosugar biosynthesis glycosyltransferase [Crocinitomicaceae bacterium]|nr:TIGR04282 family arsenosugar biosynthesis glycosyltransferase [Crocinitomicaceae bacterium]
MKNDNLLIVFVKNAVLGHAKTRLAKSIGDKSAFEVYKTLLSITERETTSLDNCDVHIYFSNEVADDLWPGKPKFVQQGKDLGERMENAFIQGFKANYKQIIGVGSDLPDLNATIIQEGLSALTETDTVFGPADDGGYYLIGMKKHLSCIFKNKSWSTESLLTETKTELEEKGHSTTLLEVLNDIDTIEDLRSSSIAGEYQDILSL